MAVIKCMLGLLALFAVSAWTEARAVRKAGVRINKRGLSVAEHLERANKNLKSNQGGIKVHGDIAVSPRPTQRNADPCVQDGCMWPKSSDGKVYVPYVFAAGHYTSRHMDLIEQGLKSFSDTTCIRFIKRTNQRDYLFIQSLDGCYSYLGRQGGRQTVSLSRRGCIDHGTVQHEVLHALGFNHEQCRSDRDQHIQVLLQNVIEDQQYNFDKINTLNQGTPYDYDSIMHYDRLAFSSDGYKPSMVAVPDPNIEFGMATKMSQNDINRVNLLYCGK